MTKEIMMPLQKRKYLSQYDGLIKRRVGHSYKRGNGLSSYRVKRRPEKASDMSSTKLIVIIIVAALIVVGGIIGYLEYQKYQAREAFREANKEYFYEKVRKAREEKERMEKLKRIFDR